MGQVALDVLGIFDPTPTSDGTNLAISLVRGNWLDASITISGRITRAPAWVLERLSPTQRETLASLEANVSATDAVPAHSAEGEYGHDGRRRRVTGRHRERSRVFRPLAYQPRAGSA